MKAPEQPSRLTPLTDPNAAWRRMPASAKQLRFLALFGIEHKPEITAGEAADLIHQAIAERKHQQSRLPVKRASIPPPNIPSSGPCREKGPMYSQYIRPNC